MQITVNARKIKKVKHMIKYAMYAITLDTLKNMDKEMLIEMLFDMEDIPAVQRIADAANSYLGSCEGSDMKKDEEEYCQEDHDCNQQKPKSEYEDCKEQDDAQRYRDVQAENSRPY